MKIKLTLKELDAMIGALQRLGGKELPIAVSFPITRLLLALEPEVKAFQVARKELFTRFGSPKGGQQVIEPKRVPEFQAEMDTLHEMEITIELDPLPMLLLQKANVKISPLDLKAIHPLLSIIEEEVPDEEESS